MTDDEEKKTPLHAAYIAAVFAVGRAKANAVVQSHGSPDSTPNGWRKIPAKKQAAATAALELLAGGAQAKAAHRMESVRREALRPIPAADFADFEEPKPTVAKSFADLAATAYQRWNSAKPKAED
jgi:hypothetical protein